MTCSALEHVSSQRTARTPCPCKYKTVFYFERRCTVQYVYSMIIARCKNTYRLQSMRSKRSSLEHVVQLFNLDRRLSSREIDSDHYRYLHVTNLLYVYL